MTSLNRLSAQELIAGFRGWVARAMGPWALPSSPAHDLSTSPAIRLGSTRGGIPASWPAEPLTAGWRRNPGTLGRLRRKRNPLSGT